MAKKKETVYLTRDSILAANDLPLKEVPVPEWGGTVFVRSLNARDRDAFETSVLISDDEDAKFKNIRARFLSMVIVNAEGEALFDQGDDVIALGKKSAAAIDRVWKEAQKLNKINKSDIEELTKN